MHISNCFVIVCNIQIAIRVLKIYYKLYKLQYYKFEYRGYLIVKL